MDKDIVVREKAVLALQEALQGFMTVNAQPRTRFEIEHFVVGQHKSPHSKWRQIVEQLKICLFNIQRYTLQSKKLQRDIKRLEVDLENNDIDIQLLKLDQKDLELARLGNVREAEVYLDLLRKYPKEGYSWEEIEAGEPDRWLTKFSDMVYRESRGTASSGTLEAIGQVEDILAEYIKDPRAVYLAVMQGSKSSAIAEIAAKVSE